MSSILAQDTASEQRPAPGVNSLSPLEAESIGLFIQLGRMVDQPKSVAEVYGMLFVSTRPLPIEELVERLGAGRESIHRVLRYLRRAGLVRLAYVSGDRRVHYEAVAEPRHLVLGFVRDQLLPQLADAESRIDLLAERARKLPKDQRVQLGGRVARLQSWSKKGRNLTAMILKFLGS